MTTQNDKAIEELLMIAAIIEEGTRRIELTNDGTEEGYAEVIIDDTMNITGLLEHINNRIQQLKQSVSTDTDAREGGDK